MVDKEEGEEEAEASRRSSPGFEAVLCKTCECT